MPNPPSPPAASVASQPVPPAAQRDGGSSVKEADGWWLATNGRWYPPGATAPTGQTDPFEGKKKLDPTLKAWLWVLAGVLLAWLIYINATNSDGPSRPPNPEFQPTSTSPPITLDDDEITTASLEATWDKMPASDRADVCEGVSAFGLSAAAGLMRANAARTR